MVFWVGRVCLLPPVGHPGSAGGSSISLPLMIRVAGWKDRSPFGDVAGQNFRGIPPEERSQVIEEELDLSVALLDAGKSHGDLVVEAASINEEFCLVGAYLPVVRGDGVAHVFRLVV